MTKIQALIVEDDRMQRKILEKIIPEEDFDLKFATNGLEALTLIEKNQPEIVISDLMMPEMNGEELLKAVRDIPKLDLVYFIIISGDCTVESAARMLNLGANDFLSKPIRKEEIIARLGVAKRFIQQFHAEKTGFREMYANIDVLLIQDGGCAPGYNPVTAFLTKYIESSGRKVFCCREGFRSLVTGLDGDFARLIYSPELYQKTEVIQGVVHVPALIEAAGANFRSERYKEFKNPENVQKAVDNALARNVKAVVAIGGNGTLYGIKDMAERFPEGTKAFFIPVTVDSDVYGTETIGQHSGVEFGAEKVRSYMWDARTHKRVYIVEMMGAKGGFHALHSCLGGHAHLAVLPGFDYDLERVVRGINHHASAVIVVAEGYKALKNPDFEGDAAEFFHHELKEVGIPINKRVVCEPFSRDIRGIPPNNVDVILSMRMARAVADYLAEDCDRLMPAVLGEETKPISFEDITTDNTVNPDLAKLSNRLYS